MLLWTNVSRISVLVLPSITHDPHWLYWSLLLCPAHVPGTPISPYPQMTSGQILLVILVGATSSLGLVAVGSSSLLGGSHLSRIYPTLLCLSSLYHVHSARDPEEKAGCQGNRG